MFLFRVPRYIHGTKYPETLNQLLRPLSYITLGFGLSSWASVLLLCASELLLQLDRAETC